MGFIYLRELFTEIVNKSNYDQPSIRQSDEFLNKFNDFQFTRLVVVFNDIFGTTDVLFSVLQKMFDISFCISQIINTKKYKQQNN